MRDGDAHPALWMLADVTFFGPERARVSIVLENTFLDTPGDLVYDAAITSGGDEEVVFEASDITHYHHARWRQVHEWGAVPRLRVHHDAAYLADAGVIPRYDPDVVVTEDALSRQYESWNGSNTEIMGNGLIRAYFPGTGGRPDIGPLPTWTALALTANDARADEVMLGLGDLAGSFSVHYRDRSTGRPISIDDFPTVTLIAAAARWSDDEDKLPICDSCTSPYTVDTAHQPSLAFVPYLLTGDPYFLDELYFWASYNFISQNFEYRGKALGLFHREQVRGQAWSLRTLFHAAWIATEGDPERTMLAAKVANNLDWYRDNAVDSNPLGWWGAQSNSGTDGGRLDRNMDETVRYYTSPWQSDFLTWAFDQGVAMGWDDAEPIRDWLAGYAVGRFTNGPGFNPNDGSPYHLAVSNVSGDQYSDWATVWQMSFANRAGDPPETLPSVNCAFCYPANARVALTAAIHGSLADSAEAYDFVDEGLAPHKELFSSDPTWAIVP